MIDIFPLPVPKRYHLLISIVGTIGTIDDLIEKEKAIVSTEIKIVGSLFEILMDNANNRKLSTIGEITSKVSTGLNPRKNFKLGLGNNFYVTVKNFVTDNLMLDDRCDKVTNEALAKINRRSDLRKGDVLMSGIGTIGRIYLISTEPRNWNISESVFSLRAKDDIGSAFLYSLLKSKDFQSYALSNASGSAQQGLRMEFLKAYRFHMPTMEQLALFNKKAKDILDSAAVSQKKVQSLESLKSLFLQKYF